MGMVVNPYLFVVAPSSGALVNKSAGQTLSTSATALTWGAEVFDLNGWHDNVTNNSRLSVPSGVSLVRVISNSLVTPNPVNLWHHKGGAVFSGQGWSSSQGLSGFGAALNCTSAIVSVTGGTDYFETISNASSGSYTPSTEDWTWFFVEAIEVTRKYAVVQKSSNQVTNNGTPTVVTWNTELADTHSWHDTVTNNSRLTVPSGVSLVRLAANVWENNTATNTFATITKNGAAAMGLPARQTNHAGFDIQNLCSAPIVVTAGDYFEVSVTTTGASNVNTNAGCWFMIEEVPSSYKRALVSLSGNQALTASTDTTLNWASETYDTDSMHDTVTNNSRLVVPSGVTKARVSFSLNGSSAANNFAGWVTKNGSTFRGMPRASAVAATTRDVGGVSAWVDVSPGDYFECIARSDNQARNVVSGNNTWFCLECQ